MFNVIISTILFIILVFFLNKNALEEENKATSLVKGFLYPHS